MTRRLTVLASCLLASCAATFGRGPFMVPIDSKPQGAMVSYRGANVGVTPCTVSMQNDPRVLTLSLSGHHDHTVDVGSADNAGWVLLGILLWGPLELFFDAVTGSFTRTNDSPVLVEMAPLTGDRPETWVRPQRQLPPDRNTPRWR